MNRKYLIFIIAFVVIVCCFLLFTKNGLGHYQNDTLKEVGVYDFAGIENLKLKGTVMSKKPNISNFNDTGILRIKIIRSNIKHYDPREYQANYYCIIMNGKAEVYINTLEPVKIGDTISIDIRDNKTVIYNTQRSFHQLRTPIRIYPRDFFDYIKREGYSEFKR